MCWHGQLQPAWRCRDITEARRSAAALLLLPPVFQLRRVRLLCPLHQRLQLPRLRQRRQQLEGKGAARWRCGEQGSGMCAAGYQAGTRLLVCCIAPHVLPACSLRGKFAAVRTCSRCAAGCSRLPTAGGAPPPLPAPPAACMVGTWSQKRLPNGCKEGHQFISCRSAKAPCRWHAQSSPVR